MQRVRDLMTRTVKLAHPDASLPEVAREMQQSDIGMMPVSEGERVIGTITDRDIVVNAVSKGGVIDNQTVRHAMTEGIETVYEDDSVEEAARVMERCRVRRLAVLNDRKELTGLIAMADLARGTARPQPVQDALRGAAGG